MLTDADVLKLNCEFVAQVKKYLASRSYIAEPSIDCVLPYFKYVGLASIKDCLDYDILCTLLNAANSFDKVVTDCPPTTTPCPDQIALTLSYDTNICTETYSLNGYPNDTAFMECYTTPGSQYVKGRIKVKKTRSCGTTQNQLLVSGCADGNCYEWYESISKWVSGGSGATYGNDVINADSKFVYLLLKIGQPDGTVVQTWVNVITEHLAPNPTTCPGCTTINPSDLIFGSPNFNTAFITLMDNISIATYGVPGKHAMSAFYSAVNNTIHLVCIATHEPANNEWIGFDFGDTVGQVYNNDSQKYAQIWSKISKNSTAILIKEDVANISSCGGSITYTVGNPSGGVEFIYPNYDSNNTKFNKIVLASPASKDGLSLTGNTTTTCISYTLTATYAPNPNIVVAYWTDGNTVISTENTATVTEPGTYTFIIETFNGCTISDSITIP